MFLPFDLLTMHKVMPELMTLDSSINGIILFLFGLQVHLNIC